MGEKNSKTTNEEIDQLSYEQAFSELESTVRELENEQASLEATLALFERGQALVRHCTSLLEKADLRLKILADIPEGEEPDEEDQPE